MKTDSTKCSNLSKILLGLLTILIFLPSFASSEEKYVFDRMWPASQQLHFFNSPRGIAIDTEGYIYVADTYNHRVQKLNNNGQFVTSWGSKGNLNTQFNFPAGIAVDNSANLYVADSENYQIKKFTTNGQFLASWGGQGTGPGQFDWIPAGASEYLIGMAVDLSGNLYITDAGNDRIQVFSSEGEFVDVWTDSFAAPSGIAIDPYGNIFVIDQTNKIQKFTSGRVFIGRWEETTETAGLLGKPTGIAIDPSGFVYVSDKEKNNVLKLDFNLSFIKEVGDIQFAAGACPGVFRKPMGLGVDVNGNLYIADAGNNRIQKLDTDKEIGEEQFLVAYGSYGREPGELLWPGGIDIDSSGNVYVADVYNNRIQKFTSEGQLLAHLGEVYADLFGLPTDITVDAVGNVFVTNTYGIYPDYIHGIKKLSSDLIMIEGWSVDDSQYPLQYPVGIVTDSQGNIFVADAGNHRIQKFDSSGTYITKWGSKGTGTDQFLWSELEGNPFSAWWEVDFVIGMAVDSHDNVYVVDRGNHTVKKFSSDGSFLAQFGSLGSGDGEFIYPSGISINTAGHIFVTDTGNYRVQEFEEFEPNQFQFIAQWGRKGTQPGQMNMPVDVAVSSDGHVYVTDSGGNNHIQVFKKVAPTRNKAIILAGGGAFPGNNLWDATQMNANFAYRTLTYQGFTKESIYYLTSDTDLDLDTNGLFDDVDGGTTNNELQTAINWASDADNLILYLVDHGGNNTFRMSATQTLSSSDLDIWLDSLQSNIPGNVTVIYDACESGSFLSSLTPPADKERIVITSTSPAESAYFVAQGSVSFSSFFWTQIFNGLNVKAAFDMTKAAVGLTTVNQNPLLDDNGNGVYETEEGGDGTLAQNTSIGNGTDIFGAAPVIGVVSQTQSISNTNSALLFADNVADTDGIARVWAIIYPPNYNQSSADNPVSGLPSVDLMPVNGNPDRFEATYKDFSITGTYQIVIYARDRVGNTSTPKVTTVIVNSPLKRKAIIVAGSWQSDTLWPAIEKNAVLAYNALKFQGYTDEDIYVMSSQAITGISVDDDASTSNLANVLSNWAPIEAQNVTLYIVTNGNHKTFRINQTESVSATELDSLLDNLQSSIPGKLTVIYDACRSGSFISSLSPPEGKERILISSTSSDQPAHFLSNGDISFSSFFWSQILNGADLYKAYVNAKNAMWNLSRGKQTAILDDNCNGIGNEKSDGNVARYYTLGAGIMLAGDDPLIGSVSPEQILNGQTTASLWAQDVTTTGTIGKVWAVITPPSRGQSLPELPITDLPIVDLVLNQANNRWEGSYNDFGTYGTYNISFYAMDTAGNISIPSTTSVIQYTGSDTFEDDDSYSTANVITINAPEAQRHTFYDEGDQDWVMFYGVTGESYEIKTENLGSNCDTVVVLYDKDGKTLLTNPDPPDSIGDSYGYGVGELISWQCPADGIYYVMVKQYDPADYGQNTEYDLSVYYLVGGEPGTLVGQVSDGLGNGVGGALVKTYVGTPAKLIATLTYPNGYYILVLPSGTYTITVSGSAFDDEVLSGVVIESNNYTTQNFGVIVEDYSPPSTPGNLVSSPLKEVWANDNTIEVSWTAGSDTGSGVAGYSFLWNTNEITDPDNTVDTTSLSTISPALVDGNSHYFHIVTVDNGGNISAPVHLGPFMIDTTVPSGTITYNIIEPTNQDVIATLQPSEAVTVTNNGSLTTRTFTQNGSFTFEFKDAAGNTGTATATVSNIDKTAPAAVLTGAPSGIVSFNTFEITVGGEDVVQYKYKLDDGVFGSAVDVAEHIILEALNQGTHTLYVIGKDSAGNWQAEGNATTVSWEIKSVSPGDINGDDNVDLADAIIALKMMSGIATTSSVYIGADVNNDGKIGLEEVIYILQEVSGVR